jgi:hypothetical protein
MKREGRREDFTTKTQRSTQRDTKKTENRSQRAEDRDQKKAKDRKGTKEGAETTPALSPSWSASSGFGLLNCSLFCLVFLSSLWPFVLIFVSLW